MQILINGETKEVQKVLNLRELLEHFSLPQQRIAIELNKTVVPKKNWENTEIADGDRLEVIHFVGGG